MTPQERWNKLVTAIGKNVDGFEIKYKDTSGFQKLLGTLSVWSWRRNAETGEREHGYMQMTTTMGNKIWFASSAYVDEHLPATTLEHEWVHMMDAQTFFGWLPFMPAALNRLLFSVFYIAVLPWPGLTRAYAELRAYRRSLELVSDEHKAEALAHYVGQFTGANYFFMWPFPKQIERLLVMPSPYKKLMDAAKK